MKNKTHNTTQDMRLAFATLWSKKAVHKNKKKFNRKPKHKNNDTIK